MITPSNPKVKKVVEVFQKEIRMLTNNDAVVLVVFCKPDFVVEYDQIVKIICEVMDMELSDVIKETREEDNVFARQLIAFYAKTICGMTQKKIAQKLGLEDHTTIGWAVRRIKQLIESGTGKVWLATRNINKRLEQLNPAA